MGPHNYPRQGGWGCQGCLPPLPVCVAPARGIPHPTCQPGMPGQNSLGRGEQTPGKAASRLCCWGVAARGAMPPWTVMAWAWCGGRAAGKGQGRNPEDIGRGWKAFFSCLVE